MIPVAVRRAVLERDGQRCRWCGRVQGVELHHLVYRSQGGAHVEGNLMALCPEHHRLAHSSKRKYLPLLQRTLELGRNVTVLQAMRWKA